MRSWHIHTGDCRAILGGMEGASVDAVVTDPPYEIGFMNKGWDKSGISYDLKVWNEVLRVLKPGGHLLAFGGTRTYHRLTCAIEDVGFEIRNSIHWIYGVGSPKSIDVSKAIDKKRTEDEEPVRKVCRFLRARMEEKEIVSRKLAPLFGCHPRLIDHWAARDTDSQPNLPTWEQWARLKKFLRFSSEMDAEVWRLNGRKGKPSDDWNEREIVGQYAEGSSAGGLGGKRFSFNSRDITKPTNKSKQWEGWGTGLKPAHEPIVVARKPFSGTVAANVQQYGTGALNVNGCRVETGPVSGGGNNFNAWRSAEGRKDRPSIHGKSTGGHNVGRWPPNVCLSPEAAADLDRQSGASASSIGTPRTGRSGQGWGMTSTGSEYEDSGGASRFFPIFKYEAKASQAERNAGLADDDKNEHPTVKPVALMQWLCRLITPPGGTVLDPFTGSGSTGIAAIREGFSFIGIEEDPEDVEMATRRIEEDAPLFNRIPKEVSTP